MPESERSGDADRRRPGNRRWPEHWSRAHTLRRVAEDADGDGGAWRRVRGWMLMKFQGSVGLEAVMLPEEKPETEAGRRPSHAPHAPVREQ